MHPCLGSILNVFHKKIQNVFYKYIINATTTAINEIKMIIIIIIIRNGAKTISLQTLFGRLNNNNNNKKWSKNNKSRNVVWET
jgi:hypothetical protein